jgi:ribonuclease T2
LRWSSAFALALLAGCTAPDTVPARPDEPAVAEAVDECRIPDRLDLPTAADPPDRKPDPPAASHVLALSWSPEFCRFRKDAPEHAGQCHDNRFGFVLHGLWPQAAAADEVSDHPRNCALAPPVSETLVRQHFCMTPSAKLIQHEWHAHGTCAWDSAEAYFAEAAKLWARTRKPDFRSGARSVNTVADIRAAFVAENPGLSRAAIFVERSNNGWLKEVRLCMNLDFAYVACEGGSGARDDMPISVWRGGLSSRPPASPYRDDAGQDGA